jgi:Response regulator of the LytR/AlgR family
MKAIVIENEKLSADALKSMLGKEYPGSEILGTCRTVKEGIAMLSNPAIKPDIIFADVRLSDGTCFAIFDRVKVDAPIVFTTAFGSYALKAFEYYSAAYIVKPVMQEDIRPAVEKAMKMKGALDVEGIHETTLDLSQNKFPTMRKILLTHGDRYTLVGVEEICAIVSDGRHAKVFMEDGKTGYHQRNLRFFEDSLDMTKFEKVSRQVIVALDKIKGGKLLSEETIRLVFRTKLSEEIEIPYNKFIKITETLL